ncbi:MAG: sulfotransferase domain-containing protein [Pelagibacterales bacterium]|nr:sulfotransferase domain-containing protein [Pelagibacterales bacterium]
MLHFKPNLFVPGAAKSGTTSLHNLLNQHPEICMSSVKEPGYWKNEKFKDFKNIEKENYLNLFMKSKHKIFGESTTAYMYYDTFINNINSNYNVSPKFIFILRNPIDRFNSHFWWIKGLGLEKSNFQEALSKDQNNEFKAYNYYPKYYFQFGLYAKWLKRFYNCFDRSNIKIITFEDLINNQLKTANSCFEFLGLKKLNSISNHTSNQTALLKNPQLYHFLNKSAMGKYSFTKIGKYFLPKKTINWIKLNIKDNLKNWKKENVSYPKISKENRSELKALYFKDVSDLKKLTEYNYKEWTDFNSQE